MKYRSRLKYCMFFSFTVLFCSATGYCKQKAKIPFFMAPYWDEGKAEFQVYEGSVGKYGEKRKSVHKMILVKENFDKKKYIKSDKGTLEVIKFNYISAIPTGMYDYFQMSSIFFERSSGEVIKYTMSSQDGCGMTYVKYNRLNGSRLIYDSYFDEQGEISKQLPDEKFVFYDALPVYLRFKLDKKLRYKIALLDSIISSKYENPGINIAEVTTSVIEDFKLKDKIYKKVYYVEVVWEAGKDVFVFENAIPYRLISWRKHNGDELVIKKSFFIEYWKKKSNKDRKLIEW